MKASQQLVFPPSLCSGLSSCCVSTGDKFTVLAEDESDDEEDEEFEGAGTEQIMLP